MAIIAPRRRSRARRLGAAGGGLLSLAFRFSITLVVIAVLAGAVLFMRLSQGPVELPWLGQFLVARTNATSETIRVDVENVVLDLGDGSIPTGLEFRDVDITSPEGKPLFRVPRLRASFDYADLLRGRVRPTRIAVLSADAQFIRAADGRIRFGLGQSDGIALDGTEGPGAQSTDDGVETLAKLIDGLVGDSDLAPEVEKLRLVEIVDARIGISDRRDGGSLLTRAATLRLRRDDGGATAELEIAHGPDAPSEEIALIVADRRKGSGRTMVEGRFGRVDIRRIAALEPSLDAFAALDTLLEGKFTASIDRTGAITRFGARLVSNGGTLSVGDDIHRFDAADIRLTGVPGSGRLIIEQAHLNTPNAAISASGVLQADRSGTDRWSTVRAEIDLGSLWLDAGMPFEDAETFDRGQFVALWDSDTDTVRLLESWIGTEEFALRLRGRLRSGSGGAVADLAIGAERITAAELIRYWPPDAVSDARSWIDNNIREALLTGVSADVRLTEDDVDLALDAGIKDMVGTYVDSMTPIRDASGEIFVDEDSLFLSFASGRVVPDGGAPISLAGSTARITGFNEQVTPGAFSVTARGNTDSVLSLLNEKPLQLVDKLGVDLGRVGGDAIVRAAIAFPLVNDLRISDIDVSADAELRDVNLAMPLGDGKPVSVRADRLKVSADTRRLALSGPMRLEGAPVNVEWREDYSTSPGSRRIRLAGEATGKMLTQLGIDAGILAGSAELRVDLDQRGSEAMRFELESNLRDAGLNLDALGWSKRKGAPGRLTARGAVGRVTVIDAVSLETPGFRAEGALEIDASGRMIRADFAQVRIPGKIDARVMIQPGSDGVQNVRVTGTYLNVADAIDAGERGVPSTDPVRVQLSLEQLQLTDGIIVNNATGSFTRSRDGTLSGTLDGSLGPQAPVSIALTIPASGTGELTLKSANAGAALRHADIYRGAEGGVLNVSARIPKDGAIVGRARIDDVTVRSQSTFRNVLDDGGLSDAGRAVSTSGLGFRSISIPFRYSGGVVQVTDAIASSPMLGLRVTGTLDENTDAVDMTGVLSPAYALTGALNEIPLLGELLSGGRGEGIVGMTFTLKGAMHDPRFSVNPLSLLAPGVLRKVFTGTGRATPPNAEGDERFLPGNTPQR